MPISLALPGLDTRTIGDQMQSGLTPFLDQMNDIMRRRNDQLSRIGTGIMTLVTATLGTLGGLQAGIQMVQVVNNQFLELMAAGSFSFLVLIFLKLFELGFLQAVTNQRLTVANTHLAAIESNLIAFKDGTISLLQQILAQLKAGLNVKGDLNIVGGLNVSGNVTFTIVSKGPDWLGNIDLLKLLGLVGLLGATLLLLVLFVAGLGLALETFTVTAAIALVAIGKFVASMIPMVELLGKMKIEDIGTLALGLLALALFVYGLSLGLAKLNPEVMKLLPKLSEFIGKLGELAKLLGDMKIEDIGTLALGLLALAAFVYGLGLGLAKLNPELLKALPGLSGLIDSLGKLAKILGDMKIEDIGTLALGLLALAAFVYGLALGLNKLNPELLDALPNLSTFIEKLGELGQKLGSMPIEDIGGMALGLAALAAFVYGLSLGLNKLNPELLDGLPNLSTFIEKLGDLGQMLGKMPMADIGGMAVGLAALAAFVYGLSLALNTLNADLIDSLPKFGEFIGQLGQLGEMLAKLPMADIGGMAVGLAALAAFVYGLTLALNGLTEQAAGSIEPMTGLINALMSVGIAMANLGGMDLLTMAGGFAIMAAFVYALALALDVATPGLLALAEVLGSVEGILNTAAGAASRLAGAIASIPSLPSLGGVSAILPSFQTGGTVPETGVAYLHEGERVLTQGEAQAYERTGLPAPSGGGVDQSVNINGGITVTINAQHLDGTSAGMLSDEIVRQLQEKLIGLHTEQQFQTGTRAPASA
jgi:hypothetical protein